MKCTGSFTFYHPILSVEFAWHGQVWIFKISTAEVSQDHTHNLIKSIRKTCWSDCHSQCRWTRTRYMENRRTAHLLVYRQNIHFFCHLHMHSVAVSQSYLAAPITVLTLQQQLGPESEVQWRIRWTKGSLETYVEPLCRNNNTNKAVSWNQKNLTAHHECLGHEVPAPMCERQKLLLGRCKWPGSRSCVIICTVPW